MSDELLLEVENGVATITINRAEKRNAFTDEMVRQWIRWLDDCNARDEIKVIVFTAVDKTFSSGGDTGGLAEKAQQTPLQAKQRMVANSQALTRKVAEIDKPIIAAVNGAAVGGGMDLALMCDVRLATASARFAETYAKMGLVPGVGGAWFLPRLIGTAAALDMFWTSRWVDAEEALRLGIVNRVFPDDEFRAGVKAYAESIAKAAPLSIRTIKRLVYQGMSTDMPTHLDALSSHLALIRTSNDHQEAAAAVREKRPPKFTGT
ncbi:MAG: enoyl-CoA hydratase-related protein [Burkholderiaceae bacterium]